MKVRLLLLSSWSFLFFCLNVMIQKKFFFGNACLFTYNLVSCRNPDRKSCRGLFLPYIPLNCIFRLKNDKNVWRFERKNVLL